MPRTQAGAHAIVLSAVAIALFTLGCRTLPAPPPDATVLSEEVFVQPLAPDLWRHVSYRWFPAGPFPSNGLVVRTSDARALVVDTAWNPEQTAHVLGWAEREIGPVSAVVITHAHDDRLGGIAAVHARGIESVAIEKTAELARRAGWPSPKREVASGTSLAPYGVAGEIFFPGAGHSPDNVVVYLEHSSTLAGTCMIRSLQSRTVGNVADADLDAWPASVRAIRARYPAVRLVVPGHGEPGNGTLIDHTLSLLEARGP